MAIVLPSRERSRPFRARLGAGAASIWLGALVGCAGLLDLPSDPQLAEESGSVGGKVNAGGGASELGAEPSGLDEPATPPSAAGGVAPGPPGMDGVEPSNGSVSSSNDDRTGLDERADAGQPVVDAAPPGDVPPSELCGATESLGPDGLCYLVITTPLSWDDARQNCTERGAGWDLAAIHDGVVNAFMSELGAGEAWVGASDAETEGTWAWVDDGVPFWQGSGTTGRVLNDAFANWNSDEPNGGGNSDCARLAPTPVTGSVGPTWADLECFELLGSVCSGPAR